MGRQRFANSYEDLRGRWHDNQKLVGQILKDAASIEVDWTERLRHFLATDSEVEAPRSGLYANPPDLRYFLLDSRDLSDAVFENANLYGATGFQAFGNVTFRNCRLSRSKWKNAILSGSRFCDCDLYSTSFDHADLRGCDFSRAVLRHASFRNAKLGGPSFADCDLRYVNLTEAQCDSTRFTGARIYGASLWGLKGSPGDQSNLVITPEGVANVTVDNIDIAQFVYLLLNNRKIRNVLDTVTSKVVLILGRFSEERKPLLDKVREELRKRDRVPILFDFEKSSSRDTVETIRTLASMSRFVIADLTDAKSVLQELQVIVPDFPSLPIQPLLLRPQQEPGMFDHIRNIGGDRILPIFRYESGRDLLTNIDERVIAPAHDKSEHLRSKQAAGSAA